MTVLATRYSFTAQYIAGSFLLARRADEIEHALVRPEPNERIEHRAAIVAAIMQAAAALETELSEIVMYGPGHHLGSNHIDANASAFLAPLTDVIDRQSGVLDRWDLVLHLLRKPALERGRLPTQDADLLVGLRNELVHHKSLWGGALNRKAVLSGLRTKGFAQPPFISEGVNDFPDRILVAACAIWACTTASNFLDDVYDKLGIPRLLDGYRSGDLGAFLPAPKK